MSKMEKAVKGLKAKDSLAKTQSVLFRCSVVDKKSIAATATSLSMGMSQYLIECHRLISSRLK